MDATAMYPKGFHPVATLMDPSGTNPAPVRRRRDVTGVKYYFIDFGISRKFEPADGAPRALPIFGGDKSVPEFKGCTVPIDPFPTDIYYLGNLIREDILAVRSPITLTLRILMCMM